jgi:hypothetical protein
MRAQLWIVAVVGVALIAPGAALAVDKSQSTMEKPSGFSPTSPPALAGPISTKWVNGTAKGKSKFSGCTIQVQLKGTTLADTDGVPGTGDEVICLSDNDVDFTLSGGGGIFRGEVSGGTVKIKFDLAAENIPCGVGPLVQYDSRMTCYEPDPAYNATKGCGQPAAPPTGCAPNTGGFLSDSTSCVCTGGYPLRPSTPLIATEGSFYPGP